VVTNISPPPPAPLSGVRSSALPPWPEGQGHMAWKRWWGILQERDFWQMMFSDFPLQIDRFTYIPFYSSVQNFSGFAWERILPWCRLLWKCKQSLDWALKINILGTVQHLPEHILQNMVCKGWEWCMEDIDVESSIEYGLVYIHTQTYIPLHTTTYPPVN